MAFSQSWMALGQLKKMCSVVSSGARQGPQKKDWTIDHMLRKEVGPALDSSFDKYSAYVKSELHLHPE
jgi:hypothetical protein